MKVDVKLMIVLLSSSFGNLLCWDSTGNAVTIPQQNVAIVLQRRVFE